MPKILLSEREFFLTKVAIDASTDCWLWTGALQKDGYGWFKYDCHRESAHKAAVRIFLKKEIGYKKVRHLCGSKDCVNPKHLILDNGDTVISEEMAVFLKSKGLFKDYIKWKEQKDISPKKHVKLQSNI